MLKDIDLLVANQAAYGLKMNAEKCVALIFGLRFANLKLPNAFHFEVNGRFITVY